MNKNRSKILLLITGSLLAAVLSTKSRNKTDMTHTRKRDVYRKHREQADIRYYKDAYRLSKGERPS